MSRADTVILVPFKDPSQSKKRLSGALSPEQRRALALALFDHTLQVLKTSTDADVAVITDGDAVAERALAAGALVVRDTEAAGETAAVTAATAWSVARGYRRQLVIPGDMAALDPGDLRTLLETALPSPGVVFAPAVGEDGTNAILTCPPDALPYRFGAASFPEYQERAAALGLHVRVLRLASLVLDVDTPEDLAAFLKEAPPVPAYVLLQTWGLAGESQG